MNYYTTGGSGFLISNSNDPKGIYEYRNVSVH